ncbi:Multiple C2 and transmembrane domain-containing protein [Musa troglodytarum]|uniref:Multiple C2 and transmembrane domain-containing protein n=1 Tax=Musa troglodytarum TaxID=320322 RepID=A0A9E7HT21_9LILI|nr:Multiple C2 and transmembrane domain-containing protein [Musa troglodytarum]
MRLEEWQLGAVRSKAPKKVPRKSDGRTAIPLFYSNMQNKGNPLLCYLTFALACCPFGTVSNSAQKNRCSYLRTPFYLTLLSMAAQRSQQGEFSINKLGNLVKTNH